ncbi:MAG: PCYCGC motif-containing (lipo)protein, partial [Vicinamibacterales bacterium]
KPGSGAVFVGSAARIALVASGLTLVIVRAQPLPRLPGLPSGTGFVRLPPGNEDCFVARRDDKGDVTEWEPHGLDCAVCLDVATEARQMFTSGASARDIRAAIDKKWAGQYPNHTPTALPPK